MYFSFLRARVRAMGIFCLALAAVFSALAHTAQSAESTGDSWAGPSAEKALP